jgi:hypothetical protein
MIFWRWRVLEELPLGGTIMAPLLANIGAGFKPDDEVATRVLKTLLDAEMRLITGGILPSDYKAFICRPT